MHAIVCPTRKRQIDQVVPEPVAKWQAVGPRRINLLHEFYADPARYAYVFQNYAFLTRVTQVHLICQEAIIGVKARY
jgi:deoxyadenosine/deoxycytidine kinase